MATFLQGATDQFGPLELYRPDYSFLTQVYGTRQAQYDRGFNMVKSLHDSLLSSQLSNSDNEQFRQQAFQKIQNQISEIAGMDLANSASVNSAMKVFDPITSDRELAYDMAVTRHYQNQRQTMESYKNSNDPEKRKLYHQDAEDYLNMGQDRLRSAKRGTGQIFQAPAREFVIFEDVQGYLDKAAKDQGLKIVSETTENGYIRKVTNGAGAVQPFEEWASQTLGDRFDRQFQISGQVQTERAVRSIMQNQNVDESGARQILSSQVHPQMMEKLAQQGAVLQEQLTDIDSKIAFIEGKHPDYEDKPQIKEFYDMLTKNKKSFEMGIEDLQKQTADLMEKGTEYVNQNLENLMTAEGKNGFVSRWARSNAMKNQQVEMRPDQVVITQWQMENARQLAVYNQEMTNARHFSRLEFDMNKAAWDQEMDMKKFGLDVEKFGLDQYKAESDRMRAENAGTGSGSGSGSNKGRVVTPLSSYGSENTAQSGYTATDVYNNIRMKNESELFDAVYGADKGLIKLVVPDNQYGEVYSAIASARNYADGGAPILDQNQFKVLSDFAKQFNITVPEGGLSPARTHQLLGMVTEKLINKARGNAKFHTQIQNYEALFGSVEAYEKAVSRVEVLNSQSAKFAETNKLVSSRIFDENGNPREGFTNAKITGYESDGTPIADLSSLSVEQRKSLESSVGQEYMALAGPMGMSYQIDKLNNQELFAVTNGNIAQIADAPGSLKNFDLSSINKEDLRDIFGDTMRISFDPIKQQAIVDMAVTSSSISENYGLAPGEKLQVTIPYATLRSQPALNEWAQMAKNSSVSNKGFGSFASLIDNPFGTVKANSMKAATGFDYTVTGARNSDGQYGVNIYIKGDDPVTGKQKTMYTGFTVISDPSDPQIFQQLELSLAESYNRYKTGVIQASQIKDTIPQEL